MFDKYNKELMIGFAVLGALLFSLNQIFWRIDAMMIISILIVIVFPFLVQYKKYKINKEIEERFPDFLRDVSSNIKAGMPLPQAVMATKKTDYGLLDSYLDKMAVQIDWGIPFSKILNKFSHGKSKVIKRTVSAINESIKGGGNMTEILDAIGASVIEVNTIRKERQSATYSQMLTGYVIFFVFLGVLVALQKFLIPSLNLSTLPTFDYGILFRQLILIQGFFSGLVIGKMSEGRIVSGLKHAIGLMVVGYIIMSFFV